MENTLAKIQEAYKQLYVNIITEEIHPDIKAALNSDIPVNNKLNSVTKVARRLLSAGVDTGLESDKPKKGSSRAVFFPKEQKEITVDGVQTKTPTAVKIAFPGQLDKYHGEESLLGEDQNRLESDHYINHTYGILKQDNYNGEYHSSDHESGGILAPVFSTHPEYHHLEIGRVEKITSNGVADATKTKDFPKGLKIKHISIALNHEHDLAHGMKPYIPSDTTEEHIEKVKEHPWVEHAISMMHDSGLHPGDFTDRNLGLYTHPVTGKKHLAMIDYGFSNEIGKKYHKARMTKHRKNFYR